MSIESNIKKIKDEITSICNDCGRNPEDINLMAVTKTVDVDAVLEAIEAGITDVGENKPQELARKYEVIGDKVNWHLIGTLQTNKVKYIIDKVTMIHSLDREAPVSYTHLDVYKRQIYRGCWPCQNRKINIYKKVYGNIGITKYRK